jgi:hypothetical protein
MDSSAPSEQPEPPASLAVATEAQRAVLAKQVALVQQRAMDARASADVLGAMLLVVWDGFDPGQHSYHPETGAITSLPARA